MTQSSHSKSRDVDMKYDLEMIIDLCDELGMARRKAPPNEVLIELEAGVELLFQNFQYRLKVHKYKVGKQIQPELLD